MNFSQKKFEHKYRNNTWMLRVIIFALVFFSAHFVMFSQVLEELDEISPFHEELAAIKDGNAWAFVNTKGVKVIDFRKDVVASKTDETWYPRFVEGKCMIKKMIEGEYYYGFIDKKGTVVIEPQYLNATNFTNGFALVIKLDKSKMGTNTALGKKMINLKLEEYVVDSSGKVVKFLDNSRGYIPSSTEVNKAPQFISKFIAPRLVGVKKKNGKWDIHKF